RRDRQIVVHGWNCLRAEVGEIGDIDELASTASFPAMFDVVARDHAGKIDEAADIYHQHEHTKVCEDQPIVRTAQENSDDDQNEADCNEQHPDEGRRTQVREGVDLNVEIKAEHR